MPELLEHYVFQDLTVYAITNSEEMLTDGDDSTCVFPSFNKFNLRFFEHFYVASIVFVLFEEGVFESDTFIVSYKTMESYGFLSEFKSVTAMITNVISNRVYVELEDAVLLDLIEIEVKFHLSICSVYLNGGINLMRNLVPARLVVEVSNANDKLLSIITDGDRYRTCVDVTSPLVIVLKPQNNTRVSRVAIYAGNQVMISMPYSITNEKESFKKDGFAMWPRPWNPTFVHDKWISTLRISPGVKHLTLCEVEVYADIFTPRVPLTDSAAAGDTIFRFWGFVALFIVVASCLSCTIFAMNKRVDLAPELEDE
ncbi:uncharacterized protein LOC131939366 [Physella acuta]|uniref:uncharacterized protein LOC131939366 n=1 Tax=Physella acuta TaxID=109671 RepID=UPI0027DD8842|nr:uncharacterized protein LOC131939366 [Physella acuta]